MSIPRRVVAQSAVLILLLAFTASSACAAEQAPAITARVERVDDGDTLRVVMNGESVRVRIFAIDAPELDQPYGRESLSEARRLLANQTVTMTMRDVDQYGRLVASLAVDGRDVGRDLVSMGAAWNYTQFSRNVALADVEDVARAARRGLWALPNPVAPWRFRRAGRAGAPGGVVSPTPPQVVGGAFHGNVSSKVFHARECPQFACVNCTTGFESVAAAEAAGYRAHAACVR